MLPESIIAGLVLLALAEVKRARQCSIHTEYVRYSDPVENVCSKHAVRGLSFRVALAEAGAGRLQESRLSCKRSAGRNGV